MKINTLIAHREVGYEIKQVKRLSFLPTIEVDNADYLNKTDTDDETLLSHSKLKKESLPVVNIERFAVSKLEDGFKMIKRHDKLENERQQIKSDYEKARREYEKCLTTLKKISDGFSDVKEDYHVQIRSLLVKP